MTPLLFKVYPANLRMDSETPATNILRGEVSISMKKSGGGTRKIRKAAGKRPCLNASLPMRKPVVPINTGIREKDSIITTLWIEPRAYMIEPKNRSEKENR